MSSKLDISDNTNPPSIAILVPSSNQGNVKSTNLQQEDDAAPEVPAIAPEHELGVGPARAETQDSSLRWMEKWLSGEHGTEMVSHNKSWPSQLR